MGLLICKYAPFWQEYSVKSLILRWPLRPVGLLFLHSCVDASWEVFIGCVLFRVPPDLPMLYIFVFYRDNSLNFNSETIKSLCKTPSAHVNNVIHGALWALVLVTFKIIVRKLMPRKKIKKQLIFSCVCKWIIRGGKLETYEGGINENKKMNGNYM